MKRNLLATAAVLALATSAAQAQSSVTLYGLLDAAVEHLDNVGASGDSVTRMNTLAGSFASRWGLRGSEDLGSGLKAIFTLESGFGVDSGVPQQGGRLFGRQAFVGLSGGWGTVALGRQYSSLFYVQIKTDPFLASAYGPGSFGDLYLAGPRLDNSISYLGKFGGFTAHAIYSLGRDNNGSATPACPGEVAGNEQSCRAWSVGGIYEGANNGWGLGGWYEAHETVAAVGSIDRYSANGYFMLGKAKLMANYLRTKNDSNTPLVPRDNTLWSVGASYPLSDQWTVEGAYYGYKDRVGDEDADMIAARVNYNFSKRTTAYVYVGHMMNDGSSAKSVSIGTVPVTVAPVAGENQTGLTVGLIHRF